MTEEERAARKKRADELRETIRQIRTPPEKTDPPHEAAPAPGPKKESPLEFINRKMREKDEERARTEEEGRKAGDPDRSSL